MDGPPDRESRAALADTIRQFLDERKTAFEFDEALDPFRDSRDPTVRFVAQRVWFHYDDCQDHLVAMSKAEWDYFQRLLLLLESDCHITTATVRRWSWTQMVALGCLCGYGWCVWQFGWGEQLLAFAIPFGIVSIAISVLRCRTRPPAPYAEVLVPFSSFAELSAAYCSARGFRKRRYPQAITTRRIRSRVAEFGLRLRFYSLWLMLSPLPLLVQTFPLTETQTEIRKAQHGTGDV